MTSTIETLTVDAETVVIDTNIRTSTTLDSEFLASVREHGILTPALGYRAEDGSIHIRAGQRRTLAARETGQPLLVVVAERGNTEQARILEQLIENDQRSEILPSERLLAWKQLEMEGMNVAKISKSVGRPKDQVKAALTIVENRASMTAIDQHPIDLLHLADMIQFADDSEVHNTLLEYAVENPTQFPHALERATQDRAARQRMLARENEVEAEGRVVFRRHEVGEKEWNYCASLERHDDLEITAEGGPDVRVRITETYSGEFHEQDVMVNFLSYGFDRKRYAESGSSKGPMNDDQKAERRTLIKRNKDWDAAEAVRGRWLADFLGRKQFPKDCGAFVSITLARYGSDIGSRTKSRSAELLGLDSNYRGAHQSTLAELVEDQPSKAGVVALAIVLGQLEEGTGRETWRYPSAEGKHYLLALEGWGYALSPVEKIAAGYEVSELDGEEASTEEDDIDHA